MDKKIIFIAIFCATFIITNIVTVKILNLGFWNLTVPCGVIIYPLVYILTNVITEVYGESTAQRTVILGLLANILFVIVSSVALVLPAAPFWTGQESFAYIFTQTPRILLASFVSYLAGNFINARLTTMVVESSNSESEIRRKSLGVLAISEIVDNSVFIGGAFLGTVPTMDVVIMILVHWTIMLIWNVVAQPITNRVVIWAKKGEPTTAK
jgi:uncharacterized integral membrane protein (TIGR00697 family)